MNYERIYNAIIDKARAESRKKYKGIYYEGHHIIPKCLGGEGKASDRNHPNIILLTAKEHYICHRLLCEIYPNNNKLQFALWRMINVVSSSNKRYLPSGRIYAIIKEVSIKKMSNRFYSEEHRKKISDSKKGKVFSDEHKKKLSNAAKCRLPHSDETKKKMSNSQKGKTPMLGKFHSDETKKKMSNIRQLKKY